jgi:hypothetical protein
MDNMEVEKRSEQHPSLPKRVMQHTPSGTPETFVFGG